jgi:hypothetical protein
VVSWKCICKVYGRAQQVQVKHKHRMLYYADYDVFAFSGVWHGMYYLDWGPSFFVFCRLLSSHCAYTRLGLSHRNFTLMTNVHMADARSISYVDFLLDMAGSCEGDCKAYTNFYI